MTSKRSATAQEGIQLLLRGSTVKKYGRQGKPHDTLFRLSADESVLAWEGRGLNKLKRRAVRISDLVEVLVGQQSTVFQRIASSPEAGAAHMSLTLKLRPHADQTDGKETLDLSCDDEETFGLWVAALRALLTEHSTPASAAAVDHLPAAALSVYAGGGPGAQPPSAAPAVASASAQEAAAQAKAEQLEARVAELQRQLAEQKAGQPQEQLPTDEDGDEDGEEEMEEEMGAADAMAELLFRADSKLNAGGGGGGGGADAEDAEDAADALFRQQSRVLAAGGTADALFGDDDDDDSDGESDVGFALGGAEAAADELFGSSEKEAVANPFDEPVPDASGSNPFEAESPPRGEGPNPFGEEDDTPNPFDTPSAASTSNPF